MLMMFAASNEVFDYEIPCKEEHKHDFHIWDSEKTDDPFGLCEEVFKNKGYKKYDKKPTMEEIINDFEKDFVRGRSYNTYILYDILRNIYYIKILNEKKQNFKVVRFCEQCLYEMLNRLRIYDIRTTLEFLYLNNMHSDNFKKTAYQVFDIFMNQESSDFCCSDFCNAIMTLLTNITEVILTLRDENVNEAKEALQKEFNLERQKLNETVEQFRKETKTCAKKLEEAQKNLVLDQMQAIQFELAKVKKELDDSKLKETKLELEETKKVLEKERKEKYELNLIIEKKSILITKLQEFKIVECNDGISDDDFSDIAEEDNA